MSQRIALPSICALAGIGTRPGAAPSRGAQRRLEGGACGRAMDVLVILRRGLAGLDLENHEDRPLLAQHGGDPCLEIGERGDVATASIAASPRKAVAAQP